MVVGEKREGDGGSVKFVLDVFTRDFTSLGGFLIIILFLVLFSQSYEMFFVGFIGFILIEIICGVIKLCFFVERPKKMSYRSLFGKLLASSFPSSHTARASFVYFYLYLVVSGVFTWVFLVLPFIVGYTRISLKKHRLVDVVVGFIVGVVVLYGVYFFGWV